MRFASLLLVCAAACGGSSSSTDGGGSGSGSGTDGGPLVDADPSCPSAGGTFSVKAKPIASGFDHAVYVAQAPDNNDDLYVVEQPGRIQLVRGGHALPTPFLDVSSSVYIAFQNAEGGVLSIAFNHDYATSGRFFIYGTVKAGAGGAENRIAVREYHRSDANHDVADPNPVAELIAVPTGTGNNIGGTIAFGPDGYLWAAVGDAAQQPSPAQDLSSRLGKILRVDVDHPSTPPPGGLAGAAPNVWDYGLRNPYRFAFDRASHQLYLADAGDTLQEEVDIEAPGQGGHDFGWDRMEGRVCHNGTSSCGAQGTLPQYALMHDTSFSVIIGGSVYRGAAIPAMRCRYVFAVFGTGRLLSFRYGGGADVDHVVELTDMFSAANIVMITSIVEDNAGELFFTTIDGNLYEIVPA